MQSISPCVFSHFLISNIVLMAEDDPLLLHLKNCTFPCTFQKCIIKIEVTFVYNDRRGRIFPISVIYQALLKTGIKYLCLEDVHILPMLTRMPFVWERFYRFNWWHTIPFWIYRFRCNHENWRLILISNYCKFMNDYVDICLSATNRARQRCINQPTRPLCKRKIIR